MVVPLAVAVVLSLGVLVARVIPPEVRSINPPSLA
jgi:hypothetical protein